MGKILIADDNVSVRNSIRRHLKKHKFDVIEAENGLSALKQTEEEEPDLILLDVMMPEMNGFEVCQKLRENCKYQQIYIIFLSAKAKVDDKVFGLDCGGDDYLSKPFDPKELIARIQAGFRTLESKRLATYDNLTGLYNRTFFNSFLQQEVERTKRYHQHLSGILMDIDHFKQVNDTYGHFAGDQVLIHLAKILRALCRKTDVVVRWGGEEFVILMPETNKENAKLFAERTRKTIEDDEFPEVKKITASFGLACFEDYQLKFLEKADEALYQAKEGGRNQVVVI
ncbi:diguanylate cyclase [Deltaproteobacteria bacterium TL4]